MLWQQVGFVCAILALVCCASGLFGSWGRYTGAGLPRELGGLGWKAAGQLREVFLSFPVRLAPRVHPVPYHQAGRAHLGELISTL